MYRVQACRIILISISLGSRGDARLPRDAIASRSKVMLFLMNQKVSVAILRKRECPGAIS